MRATKAFFVSSRRRRRRGQSNIMESGPLGVWAAWSKSAARVAISGLMNAKLISPADQDRATEIVEEETLVRLCAGDRPDLES